MVTRIELNIANNLYRTVLTTFCSTLAGRQCLSGGCKREWAIDRWECHRVASSL